MMSSEILQNYMKYLGTQTNSERTLGNYYSSLRKYEQLHKPFDEYFQSQDVIDFLSKIESIYMKGYHLRAIRSLTKYLYLVNKVNSDTYLKIKELKTPKLDKNKLPPHKFNIPPETIKKCLAILYDPFNWMILWTGCNYGLRRIEYPKLEITHLNFKEKMVFINESKGFKSREIPMLKDHVPIWKNWLETRITHYNMKHKYVFGLRKKNNSKNEDGRIQIKNVDQIFKKIRKTLKPILNKPISPHTPRYSFATNLYYRPVDLKVISQLMGHASIKTTEDYLMLDKIKDFAKYRKQMGDL